MGRRTRRASEQAKADIDGLASNRGVAAGVYKEKRTFGVDFYKKAKGGDFVFAFLREASDFGKVALRAKAQKMIDCGSNGLEYWGDYAVEVGRGSDPKKVYRPTKKKN